MWELFYSGGLPTKRSIFQWATDYQHRDKTTQPTDFHLLEDLTIHSYQARLIAIDKLWIQEQAPGLKLYDNQAIGKWVLELSSSHWIKAMEWLDLRMEEKTFIPIHTWNNCWNNYVQFCCIMEPYITLCYAIKNGNIGLLKHQMREVYIIFQALAISKLKYAKAMLR